MIDRVVARAGADLEIPRSFIWLVIGFLQLLVGAVMVFALAWIVLLFISGGGVPVGTFDAPFLGLDPDAARAAHRIGPRQRRPRLDPGIARRVGRTPRCRTLRITHRRGRA